MSVYLLVVLFSPVSVIPPMLHIRLHLHVALTKRTKGQSLPKSSSLSEILERWI